MASGHQMAELISVIYQKMFFEYTHQFIYLFILKHA